MDDPKKEEMEEWSNPCGYFEVKSSNYQPEFSEHVAKEAIKLLNESKVHNNTVAKLHSYSSYEDLLNDWKNKEWLRNFPYWKDGEIDRTDLVLPKAEEYLLDEKTNTTVNEMTPEEINRTLPFLAKAMKMLGRSLRAVSDSLNENDRYERPLKDNLKTMSARMQYLLCLTFDVVKSRGLEMLPLYDSQVLKIENPQELTAQAFLLYRDTLKFLHYVNVFFDALSKKQEP